MITTQPPFTSSTVCLLYTKFIIYFIYLFFRHSKYSWSLWSPHDCQWLTTLTVCLTPHKVHYSIYLFFQWLSTLAIHNRIQCDSQNQFNSDISPIWTFPMNTITFKYSRAILIRYENLQAPLEVIKDHIISSIQNTHVVVLYQRINIWSSKILRKRHPILQFIIQLIFILKYIIAKWHQ